MKGRQRMAVLIAVAVLCLQTKISYVCVWNEQWTLPPFQGKGEHRPNGTAQRKLAGRKHFWTFRRARARLRLFSSADMRAEEGRGEGGERPPNGGRRSDSLLTRESTSRMSE